MAMGGGGGGSGGGFPEPEDSVLFRRGTGEVRLRPRCRDQPPHSFLGRSAHCAAVIRMFLRLSHLGASASSSFFAQLGLRNDFDRCRYLTARWLSTP